MYAAAVKINDVAIPAITFPNKYRQNDNDDDIFPTDTLFINVLL